MNKARPHIMKVGTPPLIDRLGHEVHWACFLCVLNTAAELTTLAARVRMVEPPLGVGRDAQEAYEDWVRQQPSI